MEKNVLVSVIGVQSDPISKEKDEIEVITKGKYYDKGSKRYITYKETELETTKSVLSTVKIEKDRVTLSRLGNNSTNMLFEVGKKHVSHYNTMFGAFELGITTRKMDINMQDSQGEIRINYLLEVNNSPVGINDICIKVQEDMESFKLS